MENIRISNRSLAAMVSGIERYPDTENGGLLLGRARNTEIDVIEAIEAGENATHKKGKVFCDIKSMEYITNTIRELYKDEVNIIGVWHKHNHNLNPPFSLDDNYCHKELCAYLKQDIISILFQKNKESEYSMRVFRYRMSHQLIEEAFDIEDLEKMIAYRAWQ